MDYVSLQKRIITDISKSHYDWFYLGSRNKTIYVSEGHVIYLIPSSKFYLDKKALHSRIDLFEKHVFVTKKHLDSLYSIKDTSIRILTNTIKSRTIAKFQILNSNVYIYCDNSFLKYFGKNVTYKGLGARMPLYVYEDNKLVGIVCPIAPPEGEL